MIESLRARFIIIGAVALLAAVWLVPNFVPEEQLSWWPSKTRLVYGLDIQGGLHMVLEARIDEVIQERLIRQGQRIKEALAKDQVVVEKLNLSDSPPYHLQIEMKKAVDVRPLQDLLKKTEYSTHFRVLKISEKVLQLSFYETRIRELKEQTVSQSIEVIRSRIDEFGVSEPNISAQGESRILVQLPGVKDSRKAKELIKRTAKLEFAVVEEDFPPEKIRALIKEAEEAGGYFLGEGRTFL